MTGQDKPPITDAAKHVDPGNADDLDELMKLRDEYLRTHDGTRPVELADAVFQALPGLVRELKAQRALGAYRRGVLAAVAEVDPPKGPDVGTSVAQRINGLTMEQRALLIERLVAIVDKP